MISALIFVARGVITRKYLIQYLFREHPNSIPLTPGFPLVLQNLAYDNLNRQLMLKATGANVKINFDCHWREIEEFYCDVVLENILEQHLEKHQMLEFCESVWLCADMCLSYLKRYRTWKNEFVFDGTISLNYVWKYLLRCIIIRWCKSRFIFRDVFRVLLRELLEITELIWFAQQYI